MSTIEELRSQVDLLNKENQLLCKLVKLHIENTDTKLSHMEERITQQYTKKIEEICVNYDSKIEEIHVKYNSKIDTLIKPARSFTRFMCR